MAISLASLQTSTRKPPRILIYGGEGTGKTTFAICEHAPQSPDSLPGKARDGVVVIQTEDGLGDIQCQAFPIAKTYEDVEEAMGALYAEQHSFDTLVIDSIDWLEPLVWDYICRTNGWDSIEKPGYGKGYVCALTQWQKVMEALDWLRNNRGMGVILIGHVKNKVFNDPQFEPYDTFMWDIKDNATSTHIKWADCVLFARPKQFIKQIADGQKVETHAIGSGERCLFTQERPAHPGGGRGVYGRLPYELPLTFEAWMNAVMKAMG